MPLWIIAAALGSIAATALLTWVLWRMNLPEREPNGADDVVLSSGADKPRADDGTGNIGSHRADEVGGD
jgi:hypothetical protein